MYDAFSSNYDRFVNWPARLAVELPFLEATLREMGARRVLDAACGTGQHMIALARLGFEVAGADISPLMITRAQENAHAAGIDLTLKAAGFGGLAQAFGRGTFDAVLCLGNSLPHAERPADLAAALADFRGCLRPEGLLIIQNRNFDAVLRTRERWMEPQSHREGDHEWVFLRFYDFEADGGIIFNILTLSRAGNGPWQQSAVSTRLRPQSRAELTGALEAAAFGSLTYYGDMRGANFDPASSGNLIVLARAPGAPT